MSARGGSMVVMGTPKSETPREPDPPRATPYLEPYRKAVDAFGASFEATLWASRTWQLQRFRVFAELYDFAGKSIVDAGAGQGDFAAFLDRQGVRYRRYVALEGVPEMLESAKRAKLARAEFRQVDFVADERAFAGVDGGVDVVVFSGSLNTLRQEGAIAVLGRAWEACGEALLFNFLSDRAAASACVSDTGPARRFDTVKMVEWALARTPAVVFRQDYIPSGHDATIGMFRRG